ncbi:fimbrial protein [Edaphovirga cremea]|uniref:fimbrial protein n=1 Tax=Edaphovirga cremea TaxID=2267246 RepID=UPI001300A889|nr:fimbrial protein [Edaphovirga cremea]
MKLLLIGRPAGLLAALMFSGWVHAECKFGDAGSAQTGTFNVGSVIVQRDSPIGTVLATATTGAIAGGGTLLGCSTDWTANLELTRFTTLSSVSGVYQTNLNGVGLKITTGGGRVLPTTVAFAGQQYPTLAAPGMIAQVVKTSATGVGGGSITPGNVAKYSIAGSPQFYVDFNMGSSTIIPIACSLQNSTINVSLGNILATEFTGVGSTLAARDFNLGLSCDAGTRINASMSGIQNTDTSDTSVLALTGAGNADVAKGVGAQILYNNTPIKIGENLELKTSAGGMETFAFKARYFQTLPTVKPGTANTTATLELTYQ